MCNALLQLFKYIYILTWILLFTSSSPCRKDQFAFSYFTCTPGEKSQLRSVASHCDLSPISLHLVNKRIKEILRQKHQYNAKYLSRFNDKTAFAKKKKTIIFLSRFQLYAQAQRAYMNAKFLVGEIADRFVRQALYGEHFDADKQPSKRIFCLLLKETWICFNHNIV